MNALTTLCLQLHRDIANCEAVYIVLDSSIDNWCEDLLNPWVRHSMPGLLLVLLLEQLLVVLVEWLLNLLVELPLFLLAERLLNLLVELPLFLLAERLLNLLIEIPLFLLAERLLVLPGLVSLLLHTLHHRRHASRLALPHAAHAISTAARLQQKLRRRVSDVSSAQLVLSLAVHSSFHLTRPHVCRSGNWILNVYLRHVASSI